MKLDFAKYTPISGCDNVRCEQRGSHELFVLANGKNEPKDSRRISSKVSRVMIESFLKRPSLKDMAFEKIAEMANSAVIASQIPSFRIECEYLLLDLFKNKVRWCRNGDVTLMHFADGELVSRTDKESAPALGEELEVRPELYDIEILDSCDHYFVACTGNMENIVPAATIERSVRSADNAQDLLSMLLQNYATKSDDEVSIFTIHLPPRKRSLRWLFLIPVILILVFFIIGALGKMRHGGM